ncbi:hypothetical protein [Vibrio alginolyticus]|uniref:hypothetical protein n=1 Tax=Vibrio alginolyticus TaxID=663 RepID=UPI00211A1D52|nr:hypothetical protein [Vibrio alginolyticus]MCQ9090960.1 hypothetical protein [Vibrio alginolyticus]
MNTRNAYLHFNAHLLFVMAPPLIYAMLFKSPSWVDMFLTLGIVAIGGSITFALLNKHREGDLITALAQPNQWQQYKACSALFGSLHSVQHGNRKIVFTCLFGMIASLIVFFIVPTEHLTIHPIEHSATHELLKTLKFFAMLLIILLYFRHLLPLVMLYDQLFDNAEHPQSCTTSVKKRIERQSMNTEHQLNVEN